MIFLTPTHVLTFEPDGVDVIGNSLSLSLSRSFTPFDTEEALSSEWHDKWKRSIPLKMIGLSFKDTRINTICFNFKKMKKKKKKTSTNNYVQTSLWPTFLNSSTRRNEMMFMVTGNLLMRVRGNKDIEVLPVALLREVIRLAGQDRDEGSTKSNVERCIDYLDPNEGKHRCFIHVKRRNSDRIQVGRDVSKPTGQIQHRCLHTAGSTDSRENVQYREWKPRHEKNKEDDTQHFHRSSFTGRFCSTFESMDCFFHERAVKKWTLIRGWRVRWDPKWTTGRRLISSHQWLVIRCLPRSSDEDSHEIIAHRLISGASDASVDIHSPCRELSLVQCTFPAAKLRWNSINHRSYLSYLIRSILTAMDDLGFVRSRSPSTSMRLVKSSLSPSPQRQDEDSASSHIVSSLIDVVAIVPMFVVWSLNDHRDRCNTWLLPIVNVE